MLKILQNKNVEGERVFLNVLFVRKMVIFTYTVLFYIYIFHDSLEDIVEVEHF